MPSPYATKGYYENTNKKLHNPNQQPSRKHVCAKYFHIYSSATGVAVIEKASA